MLFATVSDPCRILVMTVKLFEMRMRCDQIGEMCGSWAVVPSKVHSLVIHANLRLPLLSRSVPTYAFQSTSSGFQLAFVGGILSWRGRT
jgi:hypothetical protein